jgi:hypothetical protein
VEFRGNAPHKQNHYFAPKTNRTPDHWLAAPSNSKLKTAVKRDREPAAAKRCLESHKKEYRWLKPVLLEDDLYFHEPFYRQTREAGYSFIFTRKDAAHPWLRETAADSEAEDRERA